MKALYVYILQQVVPPCALHRLLHQQSLHNHSQAQRATGTTVKEELAIYRLTLLHTLMAYIPNK